MKTLDYYLALPYKVILYPDKEEGGYTAAVPDLPGCLTCADTLDELKTNIEDAKRCWLSAALKNHYPIHEPQKTA